MGRLLAAVACPSSAAALPPPAPPSPALDLALNLEDVAHHLRLENRKLKPTGDLPSLMSSSEDVRVSTTLNEPKSRPMYTGASGVAVASPGHSTLTLMWYCTPRGCERHGQRVDHTEQRLRVGDLDVEHLGARSRLARVERDRHAGNLPRREKARGGRDGVARQLGRAARLRGWLLADRVEVRLHDRPALRKRRARGDLHHLGVRAAHEQPLELDRLRRECHRRRRVGGAMRRDATNSCSVLGQQQQQQQQQQEQQQRADADASRRASSLVAGSAASSRAAGAARCGHGSSAAAVQQRLAQQQQNS